MRTALTRAPGPDLARCHLTFLARQPIDVEAAAAEHAALQAALADLGCRVLRLPPRPELPDAVFVEDTAIVLDEIAIVTRPGAASRRPETEDMAEVLAPFRPVHCIADPGTLEGGDVVRRGRTLYVGRSGRTNADGIAQLGRSAGPFGYDVVPVDIHDCLHLGTAACAIAADTMLVNPEWVDPRAFGDAGIIAVDPAEPFAGNALAIDGVIVMADGHPRTRALLEERGFRVRTTPLTELMKAEAGVTCCVVMIDEP